MPPAPDFSQKWRKQQACDRCRRFKVRCQYESPDDVSCIRCTKAGAECAITSGTNGAPNNTANATKKRKKPTDTTLSSSPTGSTSLTSPSALNCDDCFSQRRPIISHEERLERLHILQRRIEFANEEISMLKMLDFQGDKGVLMSAQLKFRQQQAKNAEQFSSPGISSFVNPPSRLLLNDQLQTTGTSISSRTIWLPPVRVTRFNCVDMAVKYGFYSEHELQNYFDLYVTDLALYLPFPITDRLPFNEMRKASPLLAIAAATCSAVSSSTDKAKERIAFLERIVGETIFIEHHLSLELQMVLIMMTVFVSPKIDRQAPFQLLISLAVSLSLDLGSDEDINILNDVNSDPEAVKLAFKRTRSYISLCTCIAGMALNSARQRLLQVMSHCERCCDAILPRAPDYDKPIVFLLKMMLYYNSSIEKLRDPYEPFSSLLNHYEVTRERLQALFAECEATCLEWLDKRYMIPIQSSFFILLQSLNECMLSRLAMLDTSEPQFRQLWYRFAEEIKRIAKVIIDGFLELSKLNTRFPNFMYFRPLHALTSLIRLRLVSWTMRLEIDIDVEGSFKTAKDAWIELSKTSYVGAQLFEFLTKVETWMNIKLGHAGQQEAETLPCGGTILSKVPGANTVNRSTIDTLHRIIKEVITNDSSNSKKRQNSMVASTSNGTPSSPTPVPLSQSSGVRTFPLAVPFPPLAGLTMPKNRVQASTINSDPGPTDMSSSASTSSTTTSQVISSSSIQPLPPPIHPSLSTSQSPSPATTEESNHNNNSSFPNNMYMGQYDMKDPVMPTPALDTGMLQMMYVDDAGFPGQPNDIENLLKELFNEVNSASF